MTFHPKGIFEVHLSVEDRHKSTEFYQRVLGCELATHIDRRDITFLWMGGYGSVMLGLWGPHCPDPPISRGTSHFAVQLSPEEVENAPQKLLQMGVIPLDFDGNATDEAVVLGWMPAISVYFKDPDGHSLECISMLEESPKPDVGVVKLSEWRKTR
jgi:lactoylglutathione lyase